MTDLIMKGEGIATWDARSGEAFKCMNSAQIYAPVSISLNWENLFTLLVDASQFAVGWTTTKEYENQRSIVIAYVSKKMTPV